MSERSMTEAHAPSVDENITIHHAPELGHTEYDHDCAALDLIEIQDTAASLAGFISKTRALNDCEHPEIHAGHMLVLMGRIATVAHEIEDQAVALLRTVGTPL